MALGAIHTTTHTGRFFEGYRLWERRHQKPTQQAGRWLLLLLPIDRSSSSDGRQRARSSHKSQYHRKHRRSDRIDFDQDPSVHNLRVAMPTLLLSSEGVERRQPAAGFQGARPKKKARGQLMKLNKHPMSCLLGPN